MQLNYHIQTCILWHLLGHIQVLPPLSYSLHLPILIYYRVFWLKVLIHILLFVLFLLLYQYLLHHSIFSLILPVSFLSSLIFLEGHFLLFYLWISVLFSLGRLRLLLFPFKVFSIHRFLPRFPSFLLWIALIFWLHLHSFFFSSVI